MRAVGVRLVDGREYRARAVVSNATRWDTFEGMLGEEKMPESEKLFRQRYTKASEGRPHLRMRPALRRALPVSSTDHRCDVMITLRFCISRCRTQHKQGDRTDLT